MRENLTRQLGRYARTFGDFTVGQKAVALIGTVALVLGGFLVFNWASAPTYAPLVSNLSGSDASAIVEELDKEGVPYELTNGGETIMVPKSSVDSAKIALAGKGLPASDSGGYSLLDNNSLSTSDFQEQTDFKRAMEGELAKTIEAIDGVETAVVHLAMPEKQVFTDEQEPTTASVLVKTGMGDTLTTEQVQTVVNLVSSSIEGLDPDKVSVSDATGKTLTVQDSSVAGAASTNQQAVSAFQEQMQSQIQATLDRVIGPGNATINVTPVLDFDSTKTNSRRYIYDPQTPPLSETKQLEKYTGPGDQLSSAVNGVVGPDGQMDPSATGSDGPSTYENGTTTQDNAVGQVDEAREAAPGSVRSLHIGVILDAAALGTIQPADIRNAIAAATGIDTKRGDTIDVSSMPFDRTTETSNAKELAKAEAAKAAAARMVWIRNGAIGGVIFLVLLLAWVRARRKAKARELATTYVVEQLRADAEARAAGELETNKLMAELEASAAPLELNPSDEIREELNALVERQPEDVAALLRGWLVDHKS